MAEQVAERFEVEVGPANAGMRLDLALVSALPQLSRARLQALIRDGAVRGQAVEHDASRKVRAGERFEVVIPSPIPADPRAQIIPLTVVYEDDDLLVIDKPAGMVVHPGAGNADGTLVNALIAHCGDSLSGIGGVRRPGIVHRLDKDTSGLLVVAKTDRAHAGLSEQFAAHGRDGRLHREYVAVVWGRPVPLKGTVDAAIDRSPAHRTRMAVTRGAGGRHAITHYHVERTFSGDIASLVRLQLETGRTHQIRVHLAHIGHPLLGDAVYGAGQATRRVKLTPAAQDALAALARQALHAASLGFEHPVSGKKLRFQSEPPADLQRLIMEMTRV